VFALVTPDGRGVQNDEERGAVKLTMKQAEETRGGQQQLVTTHRQAPSVMV
jgi:hypothetical protein